MCDVNLLSIFVLLLSVHTADEERLALSGVGRVPLKHASLASSKICNLSDPQS